MVSSNSAQTHGSLGPFILGEELATEVSPECRKCPVMGQTFSIKEEQKLERINSRLHYDSYSSCCKAGYPWVVGPALLPNSYALAYATLKDTKYQLKRDPEWTAKYSTQIHDVEATNAARKLERDEMSR